MPFLCSIDDATWKESPFRRWILFLYGFLVVATGDGLVYGWPVLQRQLLVDGCTLHESTLGAIFTVGALSTQGGRFFSGMARDRFGTKRVASACLCLLAVGMLGLAWSGPNNGPALGVSAFLVGLGSGAQLCVQPVADLFPPHERTVIGTLTGGIPISSGVVFLALTTGYKAGTRAARFTGYAMMMVIIAAIGMILLPLGQSFVLKKSVRSGTRDKKSKDKLETAPTEREATSTLRGTNDGGRESPGAVEEGNSTHVPIEEGAEAHDEEVGVGAQSGEEDDNNGTPIEKETEADSDVEVGAPAGEVGNTGKPKDPEAASADEDEESQNDPPTLLEQLKTAEYILLCSWYSICLIPLQYYVGSIGVQLRDRGDTGFYTNLFSIILACTAITSPFAGLLAEKLGFGVTQGLATLMAAGSYFFLASNLSLKIQVIGLVLYGLGRLFIFAMFFANCGNRFGFTHFGTLAGLGLLTSALASLLQSPMITATAHGQARTVNLCCGALLAAQLPYFVWLHRRETKELRYND